MNLTVPTTAPVRIADETFLVPNLIPAGPDAFVPINSLLIRGEEPIIVDTGAPVHHDRWLEQVFDLVDPSDVLWVFLSHDDVDHSGAVHAVLDACPAATLVANFFMNERMSVAPRPLPLERMVWKEAPDTIDAGDRRLRLFVPPVFDAPTTRGLFDERTGVMWSVDAFAATTPGAVHNVEDLPAEMYRESFTLFNSLVAPWHQWLDPVAYNRHVDAVEALAPNVVASAHGPVLLGEAIYDAFDRIRELAARPIVPPPGQPVLDEILSGIAGAAG